MNKQAATARGNEVKDVWFGLLWLFKLENF